MNSSPIAFRCNNCGALGVAHYPSDDWCRSCRDAYTLRWRSQHRERFLKQHAEAQRRYKQKLKGLQPKPQVLTWGQVREMIRQAEEKLK